MPGVPGSFNATAAMLIPLLSAAQGRRGDAWLQLAIGLACLVWGAGY